MAEAARRLVLPLLLVAAVIAMLSTSANPLVRGAKGYAAEVALTSGAVYLTLRSLNAFLSTAQEVEVGGAFIVQGTAQPFKILEPVDDTIERIAGLVFLVMTATGILSVAMGPTAAIGFALLAAACVARWVTQGQARPIVLLGATLAVLIPVAFVLCSFLAQWMMAGVLEEHQAIVAEITASVAPDLGAETDGTGVWATISGARDDLARYRELAGQLYARADELVASLISIVGVFLFQILVLPMLVTGALLATLKSVFR